MILPEFTENFTAAWKEKTTNEDYHADFSAVSSTSLSNIIDSPYSYFHHLKRRQEGKAENKSKSMQFGTIAHLAMLEPAEFKRRVVLSPAYDLRKKDEKAQYEQFIADQHPDALIFRGNDEGKGEYDKLVGVIEAIMSHKVARQMFVNNVTEITGYFADPITNLKGKFRPDIINQSVILGDFKTSSSCDIRSFQRHCWEYRYPIQAAMYRVGFKEITGEYPRNYVWIVSQNTFPFEVAIYEADEAMIELGMNWYRYAMDLLAECLRRNEWPQAQTTAQLLGPSDWAMSAPIPNISDINWS